MKKSYLFVSSVMISPLLVQQGYSQNGEQPKAGVSNGPNIIFIMTDQHRADALGCAGNPSIMTPNLDLLAADGFLFTSGYTAAPSSTPARAGLLTGMSPWHHGMLGYGNVAEHYKYEMPQMLRDQGYFTLGIGKMHWRPQNALHGFHATILDASNRSESPYFMCDYRKWFATVAPGKDADITGIGWNEHRASTYKLSENLHPTVWTGDVAVRTIENYETDKPLFLKVSFARPHSPYDPPQRILDTYKDIEMPKPAVGEWNCDFLPEQMDPTKDLISPFGNYGVAYAQNSRKHYYAAITFVDEQVGRILQALKDKGMYDNTIICFTSDHGDMMGDFHHWRKTYAYEGSAAIPYIVKFPSSLKTVRPVGTEIENPVELRDFLATFLDMSGAEVPADMDGRSLAKLVTESNPVWRQWIDMEHATCYTDDNYWCALTDGKLKYIWFLHTGKEQLFDLGKDPQETTELSENKKYKKKMLELRQAMVEHLRERGEEWVSNDALVVRKTTMLYSPNYPKKR